MSGSIMISTPLSRDIVDKLKAGDRVLITGTVYTARDAAHKRLAAQIHENIPLPFDIRGQIIYYVGPTPPKPGKPIGAAGPTTSYRMDPYTPVLIEKGLTGMIGKGARGVAVVEAMKRHKAVYFAATGGAGALISKTIRSSDIVAYEDLGTEAVRRLEVVDFPAIVACDSEGNDLYLEGRVKYRREQP